MAEQFRSGFVCFVGRPNAGKSSLTNALVGEKIAIASSKPQTTRHAVRGIITRPDGQLVLVDTPGLHRPRTLLGERLNDLVRETWTEVDVVGVCLPSNERIGPGDTYLVNEVAHLPKSPILVALATKADTVSKQRLAAHLLDIDQLGKTLEIEWAAVIPCSATTGYQVDVVCDELMKLLPEGPMLYPDGGTTDESDELRIAELIREAALEDLRDELPHSIMVVIDEMGLREGRPADRPLMDIWATMVVERDSQKGIVIGHKGERLKKIGTISRAAISKLLGIPVYLDIKVKVLKDWQKEPKYLNRLGF